MSRKNKRVAARIAIILTFAVLILLINRCNSATDQQTNLNTSNSSDVLEVHFIDVGQGDSVLIEKDNVSMLIDAGENNKGNVVVDYLKSQNIKELDYVIGTHPHSDHIGGLDTVINSFEVDHVIMPEVTNNTKTYEDVMMALEENNLTITPAKVGDEYDLGSASFTVVAPNASSYEELNDYSVGIKLTFGRNEFLFSGDAEMFSEEEMLKNGIDLSCDVLKLSHHGSEYSSCEDFLEAVNPTYAIICVGKNNDYGHPHAKTLQAMLEHNIKVYRTDEQGNIVFTSNGKTISVNTKAYEITASDLAD